jgi:hypothetical protein
MPDIVMSAIESGYFGRVQWEPRGSNQGEGAELHLR